MKTSLVKSLITLILIITPIIIAYNLINKTFFEEETTLDTEFSGLGNNQYTTMYCAREVILKTGLAAMLGLLWNSKATMKMGIF